MNLKTFMLDMLTTTVLLAAWLSASGFVNAKDLDVRASEKIAEILPPIEIFGSKFFNTQNGEQFFIKGIAYQPSMSSMELNTDIDAEIRYIDPLASPEICLRDIPHLVKLGVNTIRVYSIDPTQSHDVCMEALAENGIYTLIDLSEPDVSISRDQPHWNVDLLQRYKKVVDSMHSYSNVLGFFAGNEVTNDITNTDASPFVKAAIRDVKDYITEKSYRTIPIGYSTNDDLETRENLANYFVCEGEGIADFYGINMYEWCGYSSYGTSGYRERTAEFKNYPVPVFFSEFGCNAVRPRPFTEVEALYGPQMSGTWSGGLAYMYFEEENGYGVVKITNNNQVKELEDFKHLVSQFSRVNPKGVTKKDYMAVKTRSDKSKQCPSITSTWKASWAIPKTPDVTKCGCLDEILPCLVRRPKSPARYKELFDYVCGQVDCSDINSNGTSGEYGAFSDCSTSQKLSLEISKLYLRSGNSGTECPLSDIDVYYNKRSQEKSKGKCAQIGKIVEISSHSKGTDDDLPKHRGRASDRHSSRATMLVSPRLILITALIIVNSFIYS
ncbi:LAFE_0B08262g1_1 [Lachancea fermentati]|uniref:1,3-beta-glucanosyltransferase n=1 Tax=Lachancea fermentati TaxID=4955 RepID=A0A1G4M882_LACFM|nr:LAFE_0B08262g1_1 [Lachancea fermentati]